MTIDFFWRFLSRFADIVGILGLGVSVWTLVTTKSVKRRMIINMEHNEFKINLPGICDKIDGFVNSINDKIYLTDNDRSFRPSVLQFLIEIKSNFTFLSHSSTKQIKRIYKFLGNPNLSADNWNKISEKLIKLKNTLKKEVI